MTARYKNVDDSDNMKLNAELIGTLIPIKRALRTHAGNNPVFAERERRIQDLILDPLVDVALALSNIDRR